MSETQYKSVRGLTRGLALINALNRFDGGASIAQLAEQIGLHRTTVRRLLETLQAEGYVRRSESDDSYCLSLKVRELSEGYRDDQWISSLAAPLLGGCCKKLSGRQIYARWMSMPWSYGRPRTVLVVCPFTGRWWADVCPCSARRPDGRTLHFVRPPNAKS